MLRASLLPYWGEVLLRGFVVVLLSMRHTPPLKNNKKGDELILCFSSCVRCAPARFLVGPGGLLLRKEVCSCGAGDVLGGVVGCRLLHLGWAGGEGTEVPLFCRMVLWDRSSSSCGVGSSSSWCFPADGSCPKKQSPVGACTIRSMGAVVVKSRGTSSGLILITL